MFRVYMGLRGLGSGGLGCLEAWVTLKDSTRLAGLPYTKSNPSLTASFLTAWYCAGLAPYIGALVHTLSPTLNPTHPRP